MTKFAAFDHTTKKPTPVTGWYDTVLVAYPKLPPADALLEMTDEQWEARLQGAWAVDKTGLVPYVPPLPTLTVQQQAMALLSNPVVTVACTSLPALDGDYAADSASRGDIMGIAVAINGGLGLPSGEATFFYADVAGQPHPWPETQFLAFAHGVTVYIYKLSQVAGGVGSVLPNATIAIG